MAASSTSIAPLIPLCLKSLREFSIVLAAKDRDGSASLQSALADQTGRFKVWAGNIGAHQTGRSSLDYRLRDASHIKLRVIRFLNDLQEQLVEATAIVNGVRQTLDDLAIESEIYDSDSSDETNYSPKPTELQQLFHDIEHIITCLYRISVTVRNPTPHDRYAKAHEINTSFFEPYDIQRVKDRYPNAPEYLIIRIGKAISRRRQYFKYRELHGAKMAQNLEPKDAKDALGETTASRFDERPTTAFILQGSETASVSGTTETSYATSAGSLAGNTVRMPPIPKAATNSQYFECPYCYMIDSIKDTRAWRKHVHRDLEPYMCTFDGCLFGNETHGSRQRWFDHELQMHRSSWTCSEHCQRSFLSGSEFITHLQQAYPGEVTREQAPALLKMYAKKVTKSSQIICPLCSCSIAGLTHFRRHLAHHLEGLALFALPKNASDDEVDEDSMSTSDRTGALNRDVTLVSSRRAGHHSDHSASLTDKDSSGTSVLVSPSAGESEEYTESLEELDQNDDDNEDSWHRVGQDDVVPSGSTSGAQLSKPPQKLPEAPHPTRLRRQSSHRDTAHARITHPPSAPETVDYPNEEWSGDLSLHADRHYVQWPPAPRLQNPRYSLNYPPLYQGYSPFPTSNVQPGQQTVLSGNPNAQYSFSPYQQPPVVGASGYFGQGLQHSHMPHYIQPYDSSPYTGLDTMGQPGVPGYFPYPPPHGYPLPHMGPSPMHYAYPSIYSPPAPASTPAPIVTPAPVPEPAAAPAQVQTPPPQPDTSKEDDKFARLEKLLMDQKVEQEAKEAAKEAAAIKAAADKAAQDLIDKKIADDLAAARAAATTEAEVRAAENAAKKAREAEAEKKAVEEVNKKVAERVAKKLAEEAAKKAAEEAAAKAKAEQEVETERKIAAAAAEASAKVKADADAAAVKVKEEADATAAKAKADADAETEKKVAAAAAAATAAAASPPSTEAPKKSIRFKDAVGRKFNFPFHLCSTWAGMKDLIRQAFLHVDIIGPHVTEGHYDLVGPNGELILPQVWESMVEPDWTITMHMWPMPEPPPPGPLKKPLKCKPLSTVSPPPAPRRAPACKRADNKLEGEKRSTRGSFSSSLKASTPSQH